MIGNVKNLNVIASGAAIKNKKWICHFSDLSIDFNHPVLRTGMDLRGLKQKDCVLVEHNGRKYLFKKGDEK